LHGERGDAGGAEEGVGGEDHQVGGDSCAGRRIEAGDGEDGLHGRWDERVVRSGLLKIFLHFG
jgi:hypothetical protein